LCNILYGMLHRVAEIERAGDLGRAFHQELEAIE
jgi:hypothetical protein